MNEAFVAFGQITCSLGACQLSRLQALPPVLGYRSCTALNAFYPSALLSIVFSNVFHLTTNIGGVVERVKLSFHHVLRSSAKPYTIGLRGVYRCPTARRTISGLRVLSRELR